MPPILSFLTFVFATAAVVIFLDFIYFLKIFLLNRYEADHYKAVHIWVSGIQWSSIHHFTSEHFLLSYSVNGNISQQRIVFEEVNKITQCLNILRWLIYRVFNWKQNFSTKSFPLFWSLCVRMVFFVGSHLLLITFGGQ